MIQKLNPSQAPMVIPSSKSGEGRIDPKEHLDLPEAPQEPETHQKNTNEINPSLGKAAAHQPSELSFPTGSPSELTGPPKPVDQSTEKEFDDIWRDHRDAGNNRNTVHNESQLKSKLGIKDDWSNAPKLEALVKTLKAEGVDSAKTLTYLHEIKKSHGLAALEDISATLTKYSDKGASPAGISKKRIMTDCLHDIARPSDIAQRSKGTCGATAIQMKFAIEKPKAYAKALTTLAQNKSYKTLGGSTLKQNNTWKNDSDDKRTPSAQIMQNSIMNLAGEDGIWHESYDSKGDGDNGLNRDEQEHALQEIFGESDYNNDSWYSGSALFQYVEDDIARGRPVAVSFEKHAILVVGIDKTGSTPKVIMNSWGRQFEMTVDEFKQNVKAVRALNDSGSDSKKTKAGSATILGDK